MCSTNLLSAINQRMLSLEYAKIKETIVGRNCQRKSFAGLYRNPGSHHYYSAVRPSIAGGIHFLYSRLF